MKVALLLVGGVVVGLVGLFLYLLRFHTYLGDDPSACVNCHIMTPLLRYVDARSSCPQYHV